MLRPIFFIFFIFFSVRLLSVLRGHSAETNNSAGNYTVIHTYAKNNQLKTNNTRFNGVFIK